MSSEILFNTTFIKKFSRYLVLGFMLLFLGVMGQVGVLGEVWEKGPIAALAINAGDCESGWTFLGGDAGDNNAWVQGCGSQPSSGGGDKKDDQVEKKDDQGPKEDQAEKKDDQNEVKQDQAEVKQDQSEAKQDQAAVTQDQNQPRQDQNQTPPAPQGSACVADQVVAANQEFCQGDQVCKKNIHQRADCSRYDGGTFGCTRIAGRCGYNPQAPAAPAQTVTTQQQAAPTNVACYLCDNNNWRQAGGTYTAESCRAAGYSTDSNKPASCGAPANVACYLCDNGNWRQAGGSYTAASCAAAGYSTDSNKPASCVAPAAPQQTQTAQAPAQQQQQQQTQTQTTQQCNPGQTQRVENGAIVCINNTNQNNNANQNNNNASATGGSVTVNGGIGQAAAGPRTVLASAPAPTYTQAKVLSEVKSLPSTGLPLLAWGLAGLAPVGSRLRKFGGNKEEKVGPHYMWEQREFLKN